MAGHRLFIHPGETIIAVLTLVLLVVDAGQIVHQGLDIDETSYAATGLVGSALLLLAAIYRRLGRGPEIADAAAFAGWFVLFTAALSTFNYLLLPIRFAPIDPLLMRMDAVLGWTWAGMVGFGAEHPRLSSLLAVVYASSLVQIAILVVTLALTGAREELRSMSGTLCLSAVLCVAIWYALPSLGPTTLVTIPPDILALARPLIDPAYGAELLNLATHGVERLSLGRAEGLIAFPSFHTVLAAICVRYSFANRWLRMVFWPLNALMVPAILLHGGHHLVDLPAGLAVFAFSAWLSSGMAGRLRSESPVARRVGPTA